MDRKLLKLTLTSGSSKVFNSLAMTRAQSAAGTLSDDNYLFSVKALNYGVFFKEPTDKSWTSKIDTPVDTLLYFPYDAEKLTDGGVSVSLNDPRFEAVIQEFAQSFGTAAHKNAANDRAILQILKTTPSLDPYLLKSAFQSNGIDVPKSYLQISDEEWNAIREFVRKKLHPMISFGIDPKKTRKAVDVDALVDKIWDGTDVSCLFPLLNALQIPESRASDVIFAWKGLTFFEYIYQNKTVLIRSCANWLKEHSKPAGVLRSEDKNRMDVRRDEIRRQMRKHLQSVVSILESYRTGYNKLFIDKAGAGEFQEFLGNCGKYYVVLGGSLNRLDHATEIISRSLKDDFTRTLSIDDLDDLFSCVSDVMR